MIFYNHYYFYFQKIIYLPLWQQYAKLYRDLWWWHQLELQIEAKVRQYQHCPVLKQCEVGFVVPLEK